jgi:hypothetical protein
MKEKKILLTIQIGFQTKVINYSRSNLIHAEPLIVPPDSWAKGAIPVMVKPVVPEFVLDEAIEQVASGNPGAASAR